jgi:glycosyltransferase involved in cell wall biosynthesis
MKKSFLFIVPTLSAGGAERVSYHLMRALKSEGHQVAVLAFQPDCNSEYAVYKEITPHVWNISYKGILKSQKVIREFLDTCKPDVVHSHLSSIFGLYWIVKQHLPSCYLVNTVHIKIKESLLARIKSFVAQFWVDRFVAVSHYAQRWHSSYYKIRKNKYSVIYNGTPEFVSDINTLPRRAHKELQIATVANVHFYKGYMHALKVMQALKKQQSQFIYHICGDYQVNSSYTKKLRKYIQMNGLQDHVIFHGAIENISNFYKKIDVFLLLSDKEMLPMSILEAMMEGLPIIASNVGGIPEILGEDDEIDKWGFLVEQTQYQDIKHILNKLNTDVDMYRLYSKKSLSRSQNFSLEKMVQGYRIVYG